MDDGDIPLSEAMIPSLPQTSTPPSTNSSVSISSTATTTAGSSDMRGPGGASTGSSVAPQENMIIDPPSSRVKRFIFRSRKRPTGNSSVTTALSTNNRPEEMDTLEVLVPERIQASYGLYVWPCAPILAWYLFEHRQHLPGKKVLELGAGTALPGVVAALCGAQVTLSDSAKLNHCLDQCRRTAEVNGVGDKVKVIGLTWGLFLNSLTLLKGQVDLILGSDCFYDPTVFEDLISTVAYILEHSPKAKFLTTYQERSADWSIQHLLAKWSLKCKHVPLSDLANSNQIDLLALMQDHTIHLLEITLKDRQELHTEEDLNF